MTPACAMKLAAEANDYIEAYIDHYAMREGTPDFRRLKDSAVENDRTEFRKFEGKALAELQDQLYRNLDTLDQKAGVLLNFCGLIIASLSISFLQSPTGEYNWVRVALLVTVLFAALFALSVVYVRWGDAEHIRERSARGTCEKYYSLRAQRTCRYRTGWLLLGGGVLGWPMVAAALKVFEKLLPPPC